MKKRCIDPRLTQVREEMKEKVAARKHHLAAFRTLRKECEELDRKRKEILEQYPEERRKRLRREEKRIRKRIERWDELYKDGPAELERVLAEIADIEMSLEFERILSEQPAVE